MSGTRSLWHAGTRGRKVGLGVVACWQAAIPGTGLCRPQLRIDTHSDLVVTDPDKWERSASSVWALNDAGAEAAERIARDLAQFEWAILWPHERRLVRVQVGLMHRVYLIGGLSQA